MYVSFNASSDEWGCERLKGRDVNEGAAEVGTLALDIKLGRLQLNVASC